ncbi:hypothetical protein E2562_038745 [Oryza meyeriana var. granulata]|uniref:Uncharacterized protein n=1 Tax=Oryza meyeriana var. granulata TaxID=110450 RepID=A0A6G1CBL2_9ORYZ|nr:hypothetical protein E2562_038743 [Oryza meyeriana var. granulata]KAF0897522.1 hypothetical protein E2562_038745 [Oryza meyeriana var. granulata]
MVRAEARSWKSERDGARRERGDDSSPAAPEGRGLQHSDTWQQYWEMRVGGDGREEVAATLARRRESRVRLELVPTMPTEWHEDKQAWHVARG